MTIINEPHGGYGPQGRVCNTCMYWSAKVFGPDGAKSGKCFGWREDGTRFTNADDTCERYGVVGVDVLGTGRNITV